MKTYLSKIVKVMLVMSIALAAVLCCNPRPASAENSGHCLIRKTPAKKTSPCQHCKPSKAEDPCCIKKSQGEVPAKVILNISLGEQSFFSPFNLSPKVNQDVLKAKFQLAYLDGPPGPVSEQPLYIPFHNFRI